MENGKSAIARDLRNGIGFGSTEFHVLRPGENVLSEWLHYYVRQERFRKKAKRSFTGSAGQQRVPTSFLKREKIPLPPLPVQKKIVAILDKADRTRRLHKEVEGHIDQFLKSVFIEMFGDPVTNPKGWEVKKLEDICDRITDGEHITPKRSDQGIFLLSARNIHNHNIKLGDVDFIDENEYRRISRRIRPQKGDILVSCSGTIGRVARVKDDVPFQMVRSVALLRPIIQKANPVYLEFGFDTNNIKGQIRRAVNQSSQANLFQGKIRKLKLPLPPLPLQQKFATIVENAEQLRQQHQQSSQETNDLFNALIQKAFRGELT